MSLPSPVRLTSEHAGATCLYAECERAYKPEELKGDAKVISEVEVLLHMDDVVEVVFVFPLYYIQDLQLNQSLVMKPADRLKVLTYRNSKIVPVISRINKCMYIYTT